MKEKKWLMSKLFYLVLKALLTHMTFVNPV